MATTTSSSSSSNSTPFTDSQCAIQPRRLKDFLQDQNLPFPRKSPISLFSILRRRFSPKTKSPLPNLPEPTMTRTTSVTVKDILRWRSFRDLPDQPSESPSPSRCTHVTTDSATSSAATPRSSCWSGSDFTVGDSPVWCRDGVDISGEIQVADKKNFHINVAAAGERLRQKTRDLKDPIINDEEEQFSPISVLDFTQQHEQLSYSPFHQILDNMERRNTILKQQIQNFENLIKVEDHCLVNKQIKSNDIEERAIQLLDRVKSTSCIEESDDCLLLDFIRDELITKGVEKDVELESRVLSIAKSWVRGEVDGSLEGEMEKLVKWKDFKEDEEEISVEIEKIMLNYLLDELAMELLNC